MSFTRSFHCAVSNLVALGARRTLEYCAQEGRAIQAEISTGAMGRDSLIVIVDDAGIVWQANKAFARRFGRTQQEVVGLAICDLIPHDVAQKRLQIVQKALRSHQAVCFRDERDGQPFETMVLPIEDENGKCERAMCVVTDLKDNCLGGCMARASCHERRQMPSDTFLPNTGGHRVWERV